MRFLIATIFICALAAGVAQAGLLGPFGGAWGGPGGAWGAPAGAWGGPGAWGGAGGGGAWGGGFPSSQFFQQIVLNAEAQKLLVQPDLPVDLQDRVLTVLSNAEQGFNDCTTAATNGALPWLQIRCVTGNLKLAKNELKAIDDEAKARAAATTAAPPAAGSA